MPPIASMMQWDYKLNAKWLPFYILLNLLLYILLGWGTFVEDTFVECTFIEGTLVEWNIGRTEHWSNGTLVI